MSTMYKPDDNAGSEPGGTNSPSGLAPALPPPPPAWRRRMRSILIWIGAVLGAATISTLFHFAREPAGVSDEVRYSVWADRRQKMENLEQLFAASGARVKVLSFTDQVSGHSLDGPWTSQYEAELEFLNDCQLQESPAACWSPDPRSRNITHFRQGERRLINGRLAIDGFDGSMSEGQDGRHRYTRRIMMENGKTVGDRTWWLEQNRIPTGRGSDVAKPPGMRPGESIPVAPFPIPGSYEGGDGEGTRHHGDSR